jgi:hypothetical protein
MYNQCVVLMVSYFASATRDLFIDHIADAVAAGNAKVLEEELRLTVEEYTSLDTDPARFVGAALADKKDMSFQDMQSIERGFRRYFDFSPPKDAVTNDIILAQACRNAIVHAGGTADDRLIRQLRSAAPRGIKPVITANEQIQFSPEEIDAVQSAMMEYLLRLEAGLKQESRSSEAEIGGI